MLLDSPLSNVTFASIKELSNLSVIKVLDYNNLVVAEGTDLYVSRDAGSTWQTFKNVGSQRITAMYWDTISTGWVGGSEGALLKVTLEGPEARFELADSGTNAWINDIVFTSKGEGFLHCQAAYDPSLLRTNDGGITWEPLARPDGFDGATHEFVKLKNGGLILRGKEVGYQRGSNWSYRSTKKLYRYSAGAFSPVAFQGDSDFSIVAEGNSRVFITKNPTDDNKLWYTGEWVWTDDWASFTKIGPSVRTKTEILRLPIVRLFPIDEQKLIARLGSNEDMYAYSTDIGKTWLKLPGWKKDFVWLQPFGESKMWGRDGKTLYRAGL
jgi:hypothetical protein